MFINQIKTKFDYICNGSYIKTGLRKLTYGELPNGDKIVIDNYYKDGKIAEKRYVIWNDKSQKIINKVKNKDGKFDRWG